VYVALNFQSIKCLAKHNDSLAYAALGKVFDLPVVMTTSAETGQFALQWSAGTFILITSAGPNGPLPKEITQMFPKSPLIKRNGEVNAWDNADFRKAVQNTGKKQLIVAGITTDVCLSLSLTVVASLMNLISFTRCALSSCRCRSCRKATQCTPAPKLPAPSTSVSPVRPLTGWLPLVYR
jgi:hypothetical protein